MLKRDSVTEIVPSAATASAGNSEISMRFDDLSPYSTYVRLFERKKAVTRCASSFHRHLTEILPMIHSLVVSS